MFPKGKSQKTESFLLGVKQAPKECLDARRPRGCLFLPFGSDFAEADVRLGARLHARVVAVDFAEPCALDQKVFLKAGEQGCSQ